MGMNMYMHEPALCVIKSSTDATNGTATKKKNNEDKEIQLSLSTEQLIDGQNNDTFCTILNIMKMSPDKYFMSNNKLFHKVVREDDKLFHALVVPLAVSKDVWHQVHGVLGHNSIARTYQYLKQIYYWKGL